MRPGLLKATKAYLSQAQSPGADLLRPLPHARITNVPPMTPTSVEGLVPYREITNSQCGCHVREVREVGGPVLLVACLPLSSSPPLGAWHLCPLPL